MTLQTDWLPDLRPGWQMRRPRSLFAERREASHGDDTHLTPSQHYGVLPQTEYMELTGSKVVLNLTGSDNMKHVEPNDFVIHLRSFQGGVEHSRYRGKVSNAYTVLIPGPEVDPGYFRWVLKAPGFVQELATTAEQLRDGQSIRFDQFARVGLPLPPLEEQRRIADFLDDQVTRIDEVMTRRSAQLSRIDDMRTAGLSLLMEDFRVPMESLTSRRLSTVLIRSDGGVWGDDPTGVDDVPVLRSTDISKHGTWRDLKDAALRSLDAASAEVTRLELEDIVVTKASGSLDHIGKCALVDEAVAQMGASFGNFMQRLRVNRDVASPSFVHAFLMSDLARAQFALMSTTSTGLMNLSGGLLNDVRIPAVSLREQHQLVAELANLEVAWLTLQSTLEESMEVLGEYKRSLITAAVTGDLDVTAARQGVPE